MWTSCQELPRAGNLCFLTGVSEGTLGLVGYQSSSRAAYSRSRAAADGRSSTAATTQVAASSLQQEQGSRAGSSAAATTKVAAEQLTAGAGQQDGHVDKLPRAAKSLICVFNWFQKGR